MLHSGPLLYDVTPWELMIPMGEMGLKVSIGTIRPSLHQVTKGIRVTQTQFYFLQGFRPLEPLPTKIIRASFIRGYLYCTLR